MSTEPCDPVLETLRRGQDDVAELKDGQRTANRLFAATLSHMAGFQVTVATHSEGLADLRGRVERPERRLDLIGPYLT